MNKYALIVLLNLIGVETAYAADAGSAQSDQATDADGPSRALQITPYVWAAGLSGRIAPFQGGPTIGVDKSFSDVMSDFNVGGFINLWARRDRFVFSGDVMYVSTTSEKTTGPLPPLPPPLPPIPSLSGSANTKEFTSTLMAGGTDRLKPQSGLRSVDGPFLPLLNPQTRPQMAIHKG